MSLDWGGENYIDNLSMSQDSAVYTPNTQNTQNTQVTIEGYTPPGSSIDWEEISTNKLVFDIDGVEIRFEGREILRLREMLDKFILENHPEDLI